MMPLLPSQKGSMKKSRTLSAKRCLLFSFVLSLSACICFLTLHHIAHAQRSVTWETSLSAGPCSLFDESYSDVFFAALPVNTWPETYHETVASAVEWYLGNAEEEDGVFDCTDESLNEDDEGNQGFARLSRSLPPWRSNPDAPLTRADFVPVMRRYLEVYECALVEKLHFVASDTLINVAEGLLSPQPDGLYGYDDFKGDIEKRRPMILRELGIARASLERTLAYAQNAMQFDTLSRELDCFMRSSLDLRNGLALAAEASMCLPARAWDVRDTLRNFEQ